ncbi:MAG: hypothetical protein ABIR32_04700 [Ilumatobacteraceae bacterium]
MILLAHQGGWDEALLVAGPLLAIVGLLWLAKRRADKIPQSPTGSGTGSSTPPDGPPADGLPKS